MDVELLHVAPFTRRNSKLLQHCRGVDACLVIDERWSRRREGKKQDKEKATVCLIRSRHDTGGKTQAAKGNHRIARQGFTLFYCPI